MGLAGTAKVGQLEQAFVSNSIVVECVTLRDGQGCLWPCHSRVSPMVQALSKFFYRSAYPFSNSTFQPMPRFTPPLHHQQALIEPWARPEGPCKMMPRSLHCGGSKGPARSH